MKKYILIVVGIIYFLFGCQHNNEEYKDLMELNLILDSLVYKQYKEIKSVDNLNMRKRIDSVYLIGNALLIENNSINFSKKYIQFCQEYGEDKFGSVLNHHQEYLKAKIKLIQLYYIGKETQYFYQSHFQVDLLGLIPTKHRIKKGEHENLNLFHYFSSSEISSIPIVIINGDTLNYDGLFYNYNYCQNKFGMDTIKPEIIIKRWNDILKINCGFIINVE